MARSTADGAGTTARRPHQRLAMRHQRSHAALRRADPPSISPTPSTLADFRTQVQGGVDRDPQSHDLGSPARRSHPGLWTVTGWGLATTFPSRSSRCCSRSRSGSPGWPRPFRSAAISTKRAPSLTHASRRIGPQAAPSATTTRAGLIELARRRVRRGRGCIGRAPCGVLPVAEQVALDSAGSRRAGRAVDGPVEQNHVARSGGRRGRGRVFHGRSLARSGDLVDGSTGCPEHRGHRVRVRPLGHSRAPKSAGSSGLAIRVALELEQVGADGIGGQLSVGPGARRRDLVEVHGSVPVPLRSRRQRGNAHAG